MTIFKIIVVPKTEDCGGTCSYSTDNCIASIEVLAMQAFKAIMKLREHQLYRQRQKSKVSFLLITYMYYHNIKNL